MWLLVPLPVTSMRGRYLACGFWSYPCGFTAGPAPARFAAAPGRCVWEYQLRLGVWIPTCFRCFGGWYGRAIQINRLTEFGIAVFGRGLAPRQLLASARPAAVRPR
jgi:hypothetical protein